MADQVEWEGERLPATYANFLIMNGAVLVPFYDSPKDEIAKAALQEAFPDREIVGINCLPLIKQHGSLHCVTMQYPEEALSNNNYNQLNMKVGLIQQKKNTADRAANIEKLKVNIRKAAREGAELVVLQELHNGLYFCQTEDTNMFDLAETIPGPSTETFGALAKELGIVLVLSLFEKRAPGLYHNTAVVLEKDGTIAGKYRKMHIPDDPLLREVLFYPR